MRHSRSLAFVAAALLIASCRAPPEQGLRYRVQEDPPTLDPFRADNDNSLVYIHLLFDGLVEYVPGTLEVRLAVAESWTVSPDGRAYTFRLRPGVRFHNGREVTADDVVYSIRRALSVKAKSQKRAFFDPLEAADEFWEGKSPELPGVAAPDARTVVIRLRYPYERFLAIFASEAGSILPREVYDDPQESYLRRPVGCGPYRFESWRPGESITLARFGEHWKGAPSESAIQRITFKMIKSASTALEEYRAGGLDFTQELPPDQRARVMKELPEDFHNRPRLAIFYLGFNHDAPPFEGSPALRRAVIHAIDRDYIVRVLQEGKDIVASGVLPPGMMGHDPERAPLLYDPALAARLLAEAGYAGGRGLPEIVYRSNDTEGFRRIAERVQADLSRVGFKVTIRMSDFGAFLEEMHAGQGASKSGALFRMTFYPDWPDPDSMLAAQFASEGFYNFGHYRNPRFDELVGQARRETDPYRRAELYRRADTILIEDAALVPLYWYGQDMLLKPEFTGMKPSPLGTFGIAWEEVVRGR